MNKYIQNIQKGQEGVFTSLTIKRKFNIDFLTASLYGQIKYWAKNEKGYCFASNEQFADIFNVSKAQIGRMISNLIEVGLITRTLESNKFRKLFIVEINEPTHTEQVPTHIEQVPTHTEQVPTHTEQVPTHTEQLIESINKLESKIENKLESNNINYNMQNLDLVEDMERGDTIHSKELEEYLNSLIKIEKQISIEEKIEKVKIVISKKEEIDISQRNIEDKFLDYEISDALNY